MDALLEDDADFLRPPWGRFGRDATLGVVAGASKLVLQVGRVPASPRMLPQGGCWDAFQHPRGGHARAGYLPDACHQGCWLCCILTHRSCLCWPQALIPSCLTAQHHTRRALRHSLPPPQVMNSTIIAGRDTFHDLVMRRPPGVGLLTFANHTRCPRGGGRATAY
jgi:hypothetical protein